jgi:hypothetical protein
MASYVKLVARFSLPVPLSTVLVWGTYLLAAL